MKKLHLLLVVLAGLLMLIGKTEAQSSRKTISINNNWDFKRIDEQNFEKVNLPHTWNVEDVVDDKRGYYKGKALYKRTLSLKEVEDKKFFLYFEGANQVCDLFINGDTIGNHIGGYTSFAFDITKSVISGDNTIEIDMTNKGNRDIPPMSMDFTFFGGIYRDVNLIETNAIHFDLLNLGSNGVTVSTPDVSAKKAKVCIKSRFLNETSRDSKIELHHCILSSDGEVVKEMRSEVLLAAESGLKEMNLESVIKKPELWSPDAPNLYTIISNIVELESGVILDQVVNSIGFRWFKMDSEKGFFLNGEKLKLMGVCKHQDRKGLGSAVSNELLIRDLEMIKSMGANCYRSSHYPHDPSVFEACDRLGILVVGEIPLVNSIVDSEVFIANSQHMLKEMITRDMNHPSIFAWSLCNEIYMMGEGAVGSEERAEYDSKLFNLINSFDSIANNLDPQRLTTQSVHVKHQGYVNSGVINVGDFIGANLYMGWYDGTPETLIDTAKVIQKLSGNKPLVISEYGAGADPRLRTDIPRRYDFTLDYQTKVHREWFQNFQENDFIAGSFLWNFSDFHSPLRGDAMPFFNSKGITASDRTPKDVFYYYMAAMSEHEVLNIGMKSWKYHAGIANENGICTKNIEVFTNLKTIELFVNGSSLGEKQVSDYSAIWNVPLRNGINKIHVSGRSVDGAYIVDSHTIDFNKIAAQSKNMAVGDELRINAGSSAYFYDEKEQAVWIPDVKYQEGGFGFVGGQYLVTKNNRVEYREGISKNIQSTTKDPLYQTQRLDLNKFRADVPAGEYEVTLCFADLSLKAQKLIYELGAGDNKTNVVDKSVFSININGQKLVADLNVKETVGKGEAYQITTIVTTSMGINIDFVSSEGITIINALKLRRVK